MKTTCLLLISTLVSTNVFAEADTYKIDEDHTMPRFSYNHLGFSIQSSRFDKTTGTITIDRKAKTGSMEVIVDTSSVDTGSTVFNEHIQGPDFLDTQHYPKMVFSSNTFIFKDDKVVAIKGDLTLKGISKPVNLDVTSFQCMPHPMLNKDACGANATTILKRSDFNMGKYVPNVSDEVTVTIPVEAIRN